MLVYGGSSVAVDSTIASGTTLGNGNSAYGVRVIGGSTVAVTGGDHRLQWCRLAELDRGEAGDAAQGRDGGNGANATGPSSPGNGGSRCGSARPERRRRPGRSVQRWGPIGTVRWWRCFRWQRGLWNHYRLR